MSTDQEAERQVEPAQAEDPPATGKRAAPEGAARHPLIDLSRDPNPGTPNHAKPDDE